MAHQHSHKTGRNLTFAIVLNFVFFVIELICGNLFNSKIIIADAIHDLGDVLLLTTSLIIDKVSRKKPTLKFSYGFRRLVVIGALLNAAVLLIGSWQLARWIYFEVAFPNNHPYVNIPGLFWVSLLGIGVNLIAAWRVHGSKGVLEQSVFVHLLEDVLGWAISFLASILMWITGYHEIDRIVSILILLIVGWNVLANLWRTFKVMMAATPDEKELKQIKQAISKIEGVVKIENVHYWSLDGEQNIFTARILVMAKSDAQIIRQQVSRILADFLIVDSTIELIEK